MSFGVVAHSNLHLSAWRIGRRIDRTLAMCLPIRMTRSRRWTDQQFVEAVAASTSVAQVLRAIGLKVTGANYQTVALTTERLNLDTSHWTGQGHLKGKSHTWAPKIALTEILVRNSTYLHTDSLKRRLLSDKTLINQCVVCTVTSWMDKPLVLQLDHINGDRRDNRIENLRLLCPNCHSQTDTFAGKNLKRPCRNLVDENGSNPFV